MTTMSMTMVVTLVTFLSTVAMALGLGGIVPQLVRMVQTRSAAGQSPLGWAMGLAANLSMAYVNGMAFSAVLLCASNLAAGALCACAVGLVVVLGRRSPQPEPSLDFVHDLPTQELVVLREAVLAASASRG
jgi:hypothetical protein